MQPATPAAISTRTPRLSILDNIHVASPCDASWDAMRGDTRVRHCGDCDKNVYNLSGMSRADAEGLLVATEGKVCVRFFRRSDGTILTAEDCPVGLAAKAKRAVRRFYVAAGSLAAVALGMFGYGMARMTTTTVTAPQHVVGKMAVEAPLMGEMAVEPPATVQPQEVMGGIRMEMGDVAVPPPVKAPAPATRPVKHGVPRGFMGKPAMPRDAVEVKGGLG